MPNYEYQCDKCGNVFDVIHSFKENPKIFCPLCKGTSKKQITSFRLGNSEYSPSKEDMSQDLRENYGIHQLKMMDGSFKSFYAGVKKDGDRVREQMEKGEEEQKNNLAKKNSDFMKKPYDASRIVKLQEHKAKKAFKERKLTLHP